MAHSPTCVTRHAVLLWRMAYVKLDTGILNSTLWVDRECREVFITALLMAEPFEATEPLPTYAVRTLDPTDFEVPIGWYGMVRAAGVGIVRFAMTEQEAGMLALERLAAPDPESRSQDFEGRRLVRVDGGYIVLNFFKYRDRDHTSATRSKRYRERLKAKGVTRDDDDDTRSVTEAGSIGSKQKHRQGSTTASNGASPETTALLAIAELREAVWTAGYDGTRKINWDKVGEHHREKVRAAFLASGWTLEEFDAGKDFGNSKKFCAVYSAQ